MSPAFSPTATDLNQVARKALAESYEVEQKANPTCNKNDFVAGYVAALARRHVWSEFTEQARAKLPGTTPHADGRTKILEYLRQHVGSWVPNRDLRELSLLDDAPRTARNLRLDEGWSIEASGHSEHRLKTQKSG